MLIEIWWGLDENNYSDFLIAQIAKILPSINIYISKLEEKKHQLNKV